MIGNVSNKRNKHYISPANLTRTLKAVEQAAHWLSKTDPTFRISADKIGSAQLKGLGRAAAYVLPRSQTLTALAKKIRKYLKHKNVPYMSERMDFPNNSHMTIARLKKTVSLPLRATKLTKQSLPVKKIVVLQSVYENNRRYRQVAEFYL